MSVFSRLRRVKQAKRIEAGKRERFEQWQSEEDRSIATTPLVFGNLPVGTHKDCGGTVERTSIGAGHTAQFCKACQSFLAAEQVT